MILKILRRAALLSFLGTLTYYSSRLVRSDCDLLLDSAKPDKVPQAFKGKRVWITGASCGIGKGLAIALAKLGATVLLSGRSVRKLLKVKAEIEMFKGRCDILAMDLADLDHLPEKVKTAKALLGDIDILVNNGGVNQRSFSRNTKLDTDFRIFGIDFLSALILTKALMDGWMKRSDKSEVKGIINISSLEGKVGLPLRTSYCASKAALLAFMDALRLEVSQEANVIITNVCPGSVATDGCKNALKGDGEKFGGIDPSMSMGMKVDRVVELIMIAHANELEEAWTFKHNSEKIMFYLSQYSPSLFRLLQRKYNLKMLEQAEELVAAGKPT